MKTIQVQKKMKELDRKEMKSRSLIANILDMDDEFPPGKANTVHPSHPGYPKTPLSSIFLTRSNPNLPHSFEVVLSNFDIDVQYICDIRRKHIVFIDVNQCQNFRTLLEGPEPRAQPAAARAQPDPEGDPRDHGQGAELLCTVLYCTISCTITCNASCTVSCTVLYKVRDDDEAAEVEGDWKFAAMVLDRSAGGQRGSAGGHLGVSVGEPLAQFI